MIQQPHHKRHLCLRRSNNACMERAHTRTLRITIIIILSFFLCWTPYIVMVLWYLFDPVSADKVDSRVQSFLFLFGLSNACVNPMVYGSFFLNFEMAFSKCCCRRLSPNTNLISLAPITTEKAPIDEALRRDECVHLGRNGHGTYPVPGDRTHSGHSFPWPSKAFGFLGQGSMLVNVCGNNAVFSSEGQDDFRLRLFGSLHGFLVGSLIAGDPNMTWNPL
ncbi:gonadotropin-releasing hormone II receptor [Trichonephila clavipes]|uniref:Gonadotropin-releasing hormone II receptor n=1 Tax=Trichonephila clavipes TaxID=2585209 RepID=A0A8X6UUW3_TRICX|nr:gonadotropin-releasing hormone II receptor [Trichonephila clavipes]